MAYSCTEKRSELFPITGFVPPQFCTVEPLPDFDLPPPVAVTEAEIARQEALSKALSAGSDSD